MNVSRSVSYSSGLISVKSLKRSMKRVRNIGHKSIIRFFPRRITATRGHPETDTVFLSVAALRLHQWVICCVTCRLHRFAQTLWRHLQIWKWGDPGCWKLIMVIKCVVAGGTEACSSACGDCWTLCWLLRKTKGQRNVLCFTAWEHEMVFHFALDESLDLIWSYLIHLKREIQ